jgi:spore germination protein GerM
MSRVSGHLRFMRNVKRLRTRKRNLTQRHEFIFTNFLKQAQAERYYMIAEGTGALEPKEIVVAALNTLLAKLAATSQFLKQISEDQDLAPKTTFYQG